MTQVTHRFTFGLQSRLIAAFAVVVIAALGIAGGVFVFMERDAARERELALALEAAPLIAQDVIRFPARHTEPARLLEDVPAEPGVRLFFVRSDGTVLADSAAVAPTGTTARRLVAFDQALEIERFVPGAMLRVADTNVVLTGVFDAPLPGAAPGDTRLLTSVAASRLDHAWLTLLPRLGAAGAIALPLATGLAVLLARYMTGPIEQLTRATDEIAAGNIPDDLPIGRRDELGRLARAFVATAERVGEGNARMRRLIADVSHDLRTPLTPILGYGKALRDGVADGPAAARAGAVILEEAERLEARLGDLLLAAEFEAGQALLDLATFDLAAIAEGVIARSEARATARGCRISSALDRADVRGDARKLERAIENLVTNAVRYAPAGTTVHVSTRALDERALVRVTNPVDAHLRQADVDRFFERFYRGRDGGSGLGLSIAREVAALHGGALDGRVEDGAIAFTLSVPRGG